METIKLYDILEKNNYPESGLIVYKIAFGVIENNDIVVLDMEGVDSVPTSFMNTSFGSLMDFYGIDKIKRSFRFRHILKTQADRIKKYFTDYETLLSSHYE